jgi:hypothetical protein
MTQLINVQMNWTDSSQKYNWLINTKEISNILSHGELQINTTLRFYLNLNRMENMKATTKCWRECGGGGNVN